MEPIALTRACELIHTTDRLEQLGASPIRITDIGMDLGYTNSARSARAFDRWAGVTPSAYCDLQMAM